MRWIAIGIGIIFTIFTIVALMGDSGDRGVADLDKEIERRMDELQREPPVANEPCVFDKADHPSYDGADLSGLAQYLAKDDPNNCRQGFMDRVRRFAADTCTHQPLVYPEDTSEFLGYLRSACSAVGHPIP